MDIYTELDLLGNENGSAVLAKLLGCIADREEMPDEVLLARAKAMNWDAAWNTIGGPAVDNLTRFLGIEKEDDDAHR